MTEPTKPPIHLVQGPFATTACYVSPASRMITLHGDQKVGKSTLLATIPAEWTLDVVDFDGGLENMLAEWQRRGRSPNDLSIRQAFSYAQLHAAMWNLPKDRSIYALDTYTMAMRRFKTHIDAKMGNTPSELVNWQKVGGAISAMAIEYLDRWRDQIGAMGAWGIIVCQDKAKDAEEGVRLAPDLVGACARDAAAMPSFVLHLELYKEANAGKFVFKRRVRCQGSSTVMAADRSGALAEYEPADLAHVIRKVEAHRAEPQV